MTATYWEIGRRIVEFEQGGEKRAEYGEELLVRLARDLIARFGRGFSRQNLQRFRQFYLSLPADAICSTVSSKLPVEKRAALLLESGEPQIRSTLSGKSSPFALADLARAFPLPWSYYVLLISRSRSPEALLNKVMASAFGRRWHNPDRPSKRSLFAWIGMLKRWHHDRGFLRRFDRHLGHLAHAVSSACSDSKERVQPESVSRPWSFFLNFIRARRPSFGRATPPRGNS